MGIIHGLEGDSRVIAVEIAVLHEIFDSIDDLSEDQYVVMRKADRGCLGTFFSKFACSRRASNTVRSRLAPSRPSSGFSRIPTGDSLRLGEWLRVCYESRNQHDEFELGATVHAQFEQSTTQTSSQS